MNDSTATRHSLAENGSRGEEDKEMDELPLCFQPGVPAHLTTIKTSLGY